MSTRTVQKGKPVFYLVMGLVGLFAACVGFGSTFIVPLARGSFKAPFVVYLHGAFAFAWVLLFLAQTVFIRYRKIRWHRSLGAVGLVLAVGAAVTLLPVGKYAVEKELAQGLGETAISGIVGVITSGLMFLGLVGAGLYYRRKPETHKRLLLLATLVLLWPAWFRFRHYFPQVPRPDIWFAVVLADSLVVMAMLRDRLLFGKINPVLFYVGTAIILEHALEVWLFDTPTWRVVAQFIYALL